MNSISRAFYFGTLVTEMIRSFNVLKCPIFGLTSELQVWDIPPSKYSPSLTKAL
jgi:hypothetical protein